MHKQLLHVIIYGYSLFVRKGFQKALPWLVQLPKLSKHHSCLWVKRCTWAHGILLKNACEIKLDSRNWEIEKKEMKFIIFGRWCLCYCSAIIHFFHLHPVLTCANSWKSTLSAKEIIEAQWYNRILNLYTCIWYCLF